MAAGLYPMNFTALKVKERPRRDADFHKHLGYFIRGALMDYFISANMGNDLRTPQFEHYYRSTMDKVCGYLDGTQVLDGSCSDFQCGIAHEAAKIWGWPSN